MKKNLFSVLFFAAFAGGAVTQKDIIGDWTLVVPQELDPNSIVVLEKDSLKLAEDWKFTKLSYYSINYPNYGKDKIDLKYKLKVTSDGDYRWAEEGISIRKYIKNETFISEIIEGTASDGEIAKKSLDEIEKLLKDEAKIPIPVLSATETEMEFQGTNGKPNSVYTKPKKRPISKLISDTIPFFAPEGWRYPENVKELADFPKRLESKDKNMLTVAKGDFNGDGLIDAAAYLLNPESGRVALFVNMSQSNGAYELTRYGNADKSTVITTGVMLASAGEYVNSANKRKVTIENPGFMIIVFNKAATLVYWEENKWVSIPVEKRF